MNEIPSRNLAIETSKLQLELSHKFLSNSTFDSIYRSNYVSNPPETQSDLISRRLKQHRHPLSGISSILPELSQNYASDPDQYMQEIKNSAHLNSRILETWLNNTLADACDLDLPEKLVKSEAKAPLVRFGIDRSSLLNAGLQSADVDRIYRSLFVYSIGFFQLIRSILEHTRRKYTIVTGLWKVYAMLLEYCCQFDYEMIITTLNIEKREELEQVEKDFREQMSKNEDQQKQMLESINASRMQLQQVQKDLVEEIRKREELEDELLQRGSGHEEEVTMRLQFESKLNQMYARLRDLESRLVLMTESVEETQKTAEERTEALHVERKKNLQLVQNRVEAEQEMKKNIDRFRQIESVNITLEQRLVDSYTKIEELSVGLSNSTTLYNQTLNDLAQKKIELDDTKFSLEICKGHIFKLGAIIDEHKNEKGIHICRIQYLEKEMGEESAKYKHFEQEYVKIKETDAVKSEELEKYRTRCEQQEKIMGELERERDSHKIHKESLMVNAEEVKEQLKSSQEKLEEMNKGRRVVEEINDTLKSRIGDRDIEILECRKYITTLLEEQESMKNSEVDIQASLATVNIKLKSVEKQFETTKGSLNDKIASLNEILESEKNARQNWIYRYEEEQKTLQNITRELISVQDKLNDSIIKNNNLTATIEENDLLIEKLNSKGQQDIEENLQLRAQNEELVRKYRTSQYLLERVDEDYKERSQEVQKEKKLFREEKSQEQNTALMELEDTWVQARSNLEEYFKVKAELDSRQAFFDEVSDIISDLKDRLEEKTQEFEGRGLLLEDSREFIISQNFKIRDLKNSAKSLEFEVKKAKKEFLDFRNLAPPEVRHSPDPFKILVKHLTDLKGTLNSIETNKPTTADFTMQWEAPKPRLADVGVQAEDLESDSSRENTGHRRHSSGSSIKEGIALQYQESLSMKKKVGTEFLDLSALKHVSKHTERMRKKGGEYIATEEEIPTPMNMRSIYNNDVTAADSQDVSLISPGKLPLITKRNIQPSSLVHLPQPIPAVGDFKRYLKQANSRK